MYERTVTGSIRLVPSTIISFTLGFNFVGALLVARNKGSGEGTTSPCGAGGTISGATVDEPTPCACRSIASAPSKATTTVEVAKTLNTRKLTFYDFIRFMMFFL